MRRLTAVALATVAAALLAATSSPARAQPTLQKQATFAGCHPHLGCFDATYEVKAFIADPADVRDESSGYTWEQFANATLTTPAMVIAPPFHPIPFAELLGCCDGYWTGPRLVSLAGWLVDHEVSRAGAEAAFHAIALPRSATFLVYTPNPATPPPPGARDLRPYSRELLVRVFADGTVTAAPEPATLALTAVGLALLAAAGRRRRTGRASP
jgi:hypothetical protein